MAYRVLLLVPLLLVGCASSRPTAGQIDVGLEAEIWLAAGQSNMEVFADKPPRGAEHVEVQQFGHDPRFNIPVWTSLKRAGKFQRSRVRVDLEPSGRLMLRSARAITTRESPIARHAASRIH